MIDAEIDLLAITETWLSPGESDIKTIKDVTPAGYKFDHVPRKNRRGGGIGFLYRSTAYIHRDYQQQTGDEHV